MDVRRNLLLLQIVSLLVVLTSCNYENLVTEIPKPHLPTETLEPIITISAKKTKQTTKTRTPIAVSTLEKTKTPTPTQAISPIPREDAYPFFLDLIQMKDECR